MAHYPLNHPLRPAYRFLAALTALYLLLCGVLGLGKTWGDDFFARGSDWVLGQRVNPASAWLVTIVGLILLAAVVLGGNLYHHVALGVGWGLPAVAMVVMALLQTDANILNASMINVVTWVVLGLIVLTGGLYGKVGSSEAAHAEASAASGAR